MSKSRIKNRREEAGSRGTPEENSLNVLNVISDAVHDSLDFHTLIKQSAHAVEKLFDVPLVAVSVLDDVEKNLNLIYSTSPELISARRARQLPLQNSLTGITIAKLDVIISDNIAHDERINPEIRDNLKKEGWHSVVSLPLLFHNQALGTMNLFFSQQRNFQKNERKTFLLIGRIIGLAMADTRHISQIETDTSSIIMTEAALRQSNTSLKAINTISDVVYRSFNFNTVLTNAAAALDKLFKVPSVNIFLLNEEENCLELVHNSVPDAEEGLRATARLPLTGNFTSLAVARQEVVVCEDISTSEYMVPEARKALLRWGRKSCLSLPLLFHNQVLGAINLFFEEKRTFNQSERDTFLSIGKTIGLALANARHVGRIEAEIAEKKRAEEALRQNNDSLKTINLISDALYHSLDFDTVVKKAAAAMDEFFHAPSVSVFMLNEKRQCLEQVFASNPDLEAARLIRTLPLSGGSITALTVAGKEVVVCEDVTKDTRMRPEVRAAIIKWGRQSIISLPLLFHNQVLGAMNLFFKEKRTFTQSEREAFLSIGKAIGLAMANARHVSRIEAEITERKKAEETALASEAKYRGIFDNAAEGIFQSTLAGRFITVNPALVRILGYDSAQDLLTGINNLKDQFYTNPAQRDVFLSLMTEQGFVKNFELKAYRKDKTVIEVSINAHAARDEKGKLLHCEGILSDITEKKRIEELKIAKEAAETSTKAKSDFLANMSHEIRTPLNAIIGFSGLALKLKLSSQLRDYLTRIDISSRLLLGLLNDILDFSKIEAGKFTMEMRPFRLDELTNNIMGIISVKAREKGIGLTCNTAADVPNNLVGDSLRLGQVLLNLANNAVKFTREGHILIKVYLVNKDESRCKLNFTVRDTGIGISEKNMANLFQPFSQADASITRNFGGTGLGLVICKRLVEMMEGEVHAQSEPGKGSCFSFTAVFGLAAAGDFPSPRAGSKIRQSKAPGKGKKILAGARVLLVEDNIINQEVAIGIMAGAGLIIDVVENGRKAVAAVKKSSYDIVLMDIQMPVMSGYEATELIRKDAHLQDLPVIAMTAHATSDTKTACLAAGMNDYISKPIDPEQLFEVLRRWIKKDLSGRWEKPAIKINRTGSLLPAELPGIDLNSALRRLGGNEDLLIKLLQTFLRTHKNTGTDIKEALKSNDYKKAQRLAHTIKGVAGNLAAEKLSETAGRLEELINRGKAAHPAKLLSLFSDALAEVFSSITNMEKKQKKTGKEKTGEKSGNKKTAALLLAKLNNLLAQNNLEAAVVFKSLTPYIDKNVYGDDWRRIEESIDGLDFAGARKALRRIAKKTGLVGGGK